MIDYEKYDKALIVTGDGDFYCLVKYLKEKNILVRVLAPNNKSSRLLRKFAASYLSVMNDLQSKLEYVKP